MESIITVVHEVGHLRGSRHTDGYLNSFKKNLQR